MNIKNVYKDILLGVAIGDALGVPVEFQSRENLKSNPVESMVGFGTHNLPAGTFSDDSSLTFCLAEAMIDNFTIEGLAKRILDWFDFAHWTPHGKVFDIGIVTKQSIERLKRGISPTLAGGIEFTENGNGSLMRILPLVCLIKDLPVHERYHITKNVSSLTHAHVRSVISCFYYLEFARKILMGKEKYAIYKELKSEISSYIEEIGIVTNEISVFSRLLEQDIYLLSEDTIESSGYVIHTLEASIWCIMNTENYKSAVLRAVNLGGDTDTTGAVTGGLAGLLYGHNNIPVEWLKELVRFEDIIDLAERWKQHASA